MPHFSSEQERSQFLTLSNTIREERYEDALALSKEMLEAYPDNRHIYHNQVGAITYIVESNYWEATRHYYKALEYGFDADTCEDNIWESAFDAYNYLVDSEAGFCSILYEDGTSVSAIALLKQYQEAFPEGKFIVNSRELIYIYDVIRYMDEEGIYSEYDLKQAYLKEFGGQYMDIVNRHCAILNLIPVIEMRAPEASLSALFPDGPAETGIDDKNGLRQNTYVNQYGRYIISFIDDAVHHVIYQIDSETEDQMEKKYHFMLRHYREDSKWKLLADNGSGYIIKREDEKLHALYSYIMDIWTIMTGEYHEGGYR